MAAAKVVGSWEEGVNSKAVTVFFWLVIVVCAILLVRTVHEVPRGERLVLGAAVVSGICLVKAIRWMFRREPRTEGRDEARK